MTQPALIPESPPSKAYAVVDLSQIEANDKLIGDEPTPAFVRTIKQYGFMHNVGLLVAENGDLHRVLYGRKRIKAARQLGLETVPAFIYSVDQGIGAVLTMIENEQRKPNIATDLDVLETMAKENATDDDIKLATGMDPATLTSRKRLLRLIAPLRQALREGKMLESAAVEAARLSEADQAKLVQRLTEEDYIRVKDVRAVRERKRKAAEAQIPDELFATPGADALEPSRQNEETKQTETSFTGQMLIHRVTSYGAEFSVPVEAFRRALSDAWMSHNGGDGPVVEFRILSGA